MFVYEHAFLLLVTCLALVSAIVVWIKIIETWKNQLLKWFLEKIHDLEISMVMKALKAIQESDYNPLGTDPRAGEQFKTVVTLICHSSVLRPERQLSARLPKVFGIRLAALRTYSEHLNEVKELRSLLDGHKINWRAIEQLARPFS